MKGVETISNAISSLLWPEDSTDQALTSEEVKNDLSRIAKILSIAQCSREIVSVLIIL